MLIGLVGKPSCGKSTFFKAATLAEVEIASYPFTTIKANHGIGYVKIDCIDKEFKVQCMPRTGYCVNGKRFVPVELMDVAGLVEGASEGKGLGNQFLDDLRQADAFIQIVDASGTTDSGGKEGIGDPIADIKMLENELDMWFLGILNKVWKSFSRSLQQTKENFAKAVAKQFSGLKINEDDVKETILKTGLNPEGASKWTDMELKKFVHGLRSITKPMIIAANKIDKSSGPENYRKLREEFPGLIIVPCSADSELALREASKHGLIEYMPGETDFRVKGNVSDKQKIALESIKKNVLSQFAEGTGVQSILNAVVFSLLRYIAIFPAGASKLADSKGNILPDCFLLPEGSTALDFAFAVHTDLGNNFIKAIDAKTKRALGKDHVLKNRDALEIVTR
jgi:ribosome-binding ATPase YchF (GTP1/OBG family)